MKQAQETTKTENQNNLKPLKSNEIQIEKKESNNQEEKSDNIQKKDSEQKENELELKSKLLNKPKELLGFDAVSHFRENINHTDKNSFLPITEKSYYCLECKHSECPLFKQDMNQKEHMLIKRAKCLSHDPNFFDSVENSIKEALTYNQFKNGIKQRLTNAINCLKNELDKVKEQKLKEIDNYFDETDKYLLDLKNKCSNVKQSIEDYYKVNKKFYNIKIIKDPDNNLLSQTNEKQEMSLNKTEYNNTAPNNINTNFEEMNNGSSNRDIENTVFLLNFELMNLCETKNLEVMNYLKDLKIKINSFNTAIQKELTPSIDIVSKFFNNLGMNAEKIDDYYWDIVMRTKKYSEICLTFNLTCGILTSTKAGEPAGTK